LLDDFARVVRAQQHKTGAAATLVMLLVIVRLTLLPAGPGPLPSGFHTCLLCGTYGLADFIDNTILFIPLGFALRLAGVRRWTAWLFMAALSAGIETAQDWLVSGRESALGDLVANALGGAIGIALADLRGALLAPSRRAAQRLAAGAAAAVVGIAVLLAWGFQLSIPAEGVYWTTVHPHLPHYLPFQGSVLDATLDGLPIVCCRRDSATSQAIRASLEGGTARISARIVPTGLPESGAGRITPIVTIYDRWRNEILMLGCRRGHLVSRTRTHTDNVALHPIALETPQPNACVIGDSTTVTAEPLGRSARVRLTLSRQNDSIVTTQGAGIWTGWHLYVPSDGLWSDVEGPLTVLWCALLFVPFAYWRARADRAGPAVILHAAAVIIVTLVIIPVAMGSTVAPVVAWIGSIAGASIGWLAAQWEHA
jgi:VanZ like family